MRFLPYAFAAVVLPLTLSADIPQQPRPALSGQKDTYTLKVNPRLVVLDVVVTDKNGNPVTNLRKQDFEVQEDKQPQHLYSFEAPAAHALPPNVVIHSTEELDRVAPNAPATILVLDEYVSGFADIYNARSAIQQYLKAQPQLLSQPTMLIAVNADRMIVLRDYTQDRDALLTALSHHTAGPADRSGSQARNTIDFINAQVRAGFRSLTQIAQATAGHAGHKNVIWVGPGLPVLDITVVSPNVALELRIQLQKMIDLLIASRVTISTIDLKGVHWADLRGGGSINGIDDSYASFAQVALATGGTRIFQRNDFDTQIATVVHNESNFYTLSYIPTSSSSEKGAFRKIRVVLKDPSLQVKTRTGYYPNPGKESGWAVAEDRARWHPRPKNVIDAAVANTALVYDGIPLTLARSSTPGDIIVRMSVNALPWVDHGPDQPRTAPVQISCVSFDKKEKVLVHSGTDTEVRLSAATPQSHPDADISFSLKCDTDPRAVALRVVVQSTDTGKIGAANLDLNAK